MKYQQLYIGRLATFSIHLLTPQETGASYLLNQAATQIKQATFSPDLSSSIITNSKGSVTCTSRLTKQQQQQQQQDSSSTKQCQFKGCVKGARGASGLCIATVWAASVRNQAHTRAPRIGLHFAKPMGRVVGVNSYFVQRVWKDAPTFALHMGVDAVAVKKDAAVLPEGSLDYAFGMVGARGLHQKCRRTFWRLHFTWRWQALSVPLMY